MGDWIRLLTFLYYKRALKNGNLGAALYYAKVLHPKMRRP
jgi:hypothetical protein